MQDLQHASEMADVGAASAKRKRAVTFAPASEGASGGTRRPPPRRADARAFGGADEVDEDEVVEEEHQRPAGDDSCDDDDDDEGEVERLDAAGDASAVLPSTKGSSAAVAEKKRARLKRAVGETASERLAEDFNDAGDAFEPFNLHREREDGHFDASGEFVWKKKTADDYDAWIDSIDNLDPRARAEMQREAAGASRSKGWSAAGSSAPANEGDDDEDDDDEGDEDAGEAAPADLSARKISSLAAVLSLLLPGGETVTAALRRLSGHAGPSTGAVSRPKGGRAPRPAARAEAVAALPGRDMAAFDRLTEAADFLCGAGGLPGVYTMDAKGVVWELEDAGGSTGVGAAGPAASSAYAAAPTSQVASSPAMATQPGEPLWMYRLSEEGVGPSGSVQVFGPFPASQMTAWAAMGFFSAQPVWVSRAQPLMLPEVAGKSGAPASAAAPPSGDDADSEDIFAGSGLYAPSISAALATSTSGAAQARWHKFSEAVKF